MTRDFNAYIARKRGEYGSKFDSSNLAKQFIPFFENQKRIKVLDRWGDTLTGTVGITGGWKPTFLLMRRSNAIGSSTTLSTKDQIIAVKKGDRYIPVR